MTSPWLDKVQRHTSHDKLVYAYCDHERKLLCHPLPLFPQVITCDTSYGVRAVARFQAGEVPLFLISLKAGAVELNLTAADTVIHYATWWNPGAERHARSRTFFGVAATPFRAGKLTYHHSADRHPIFGGLPGHRDSLHLSLPLMVAS